MGETAWEVAWVRAGEQGTLQASSRSEEMQCSRRGAIHGNPSQAGGCQRGRSSRREVSPPLSPARPAGGRCRRWPSRGRGTPRSRGPPPWRPNLRRVGRGGEGRVCTQARHSVSSAQAGAAGAAAAAVPSLGEPQAPTACNRHPARAAQRQQQQDHDRLRRRRRRSSSRGRSPMLSGAPRWGQTSSRHLTLPSSPRNSTTRMPSSSTPRGEPSSGTDSESAAAYLAGGGGGGRGGEGG